MDSKPAIVCVDDEAIILMALKLELTRRLGDQFLTETAGSAESALELIRRLYAREVRVILILTDWLMPGLKGDEFVALVKAEHPDVHCIMISGQIDSGALEAARRNPLLDAVVKKPWNSEQLIETIRSCVGEGSA